MTNRDRVLSFLLWVSVIVWATWFGGTLYQMLVIVPLWNEAPPESVVAFFKGTHYTRTIWNFFGPPWMAGRNLPLILAVAAGWHRPRYRYYLLASIGCFAFSLIYTLIYIYRS